MGVSVSVSDECELRRGYIKKHLHLPVQLHLEVSLVAWPVELLLTHYLQTILHQ